MFSLEDKEFACVKYVSFKQVEILCGINFSKGYCQNCQSEI